MKIILKIVAITKEYIPKSSNDRIDISTSFIMIPTRLAYITFFDLFMACSAVARGDCKYRIINGKASILK